MPESTSTTIPGTSIVLSSTCSPEKEKPGVLSSAFLGTFPLAGTMLGFAVGSPGLSDAVRIALIAGAVLTQIGYVVGNALVKWKK